MQSSVNNRIYSVLIPSNALRILNDHESLQFKGYAFNEVKPSILVGLGLAVRKNLSILRLLQYLNQK